MADYKEKCPKCGSWVKGEPDRGFVRDLVHEVPSMGIDCIPVGGRFIGKCIHDGVQKMFKADIDKLGDEVEKFIFKDIRIYFNCPNPECGEKWDNIYQLEESEYKQLIYEWTAKTKAMTQSKVSLNNISRLWKKE